MFLTSISKNSLLLGTFAIITTAVIATTHVVTKDRIRIQQRNLEKKVLREILPSNIYSNDLIADKKQVPNFKSLNLDETDFMYIAKQQQQINAVVLPVIAPNGYSGSIKILVSIDHSGKILAARAITHQETPGLGDKIDQKKSDWILQFNEKTLASRWNVKKDQGDFDQLTGATITSRAVIKAIHQALIYFNKHQSTLLTDDKHHE